MKLVRFEKVLVWLGLFLLVGLAVLLLARGMRRFPVTPRYEVPGADAERGRLLIRAYGCGACHTVPGVRGADGKVGPTLDALHEHSYIAGHLANVPDNMIAWIMAPQEIAPNTAMPDLGVSEAEARDIAAYLYSLD